LKSWRVKVCSGVAQYFAPIPIHEADIVQFRDRHYKAKYFMQSQFGLKSRGFVCMYTPFTFHCHIPIGCSAHVIPGVFHGTTSNVQVAGISFIFVRSTAAVTKCPGRCTIV